jgi:hypothetical protein
LRPLHKPHGMLKGRARGCLWAGVCLANVLIAAEVTPCQRREG